MPTPRKYTDQADKQRAYRERQEQARREALETKGLPSAPAVPTMPSTARWKALRETARTALETVQAEMQAYYYERSEAWQESDKGEAFQERLDQLADLISDLEEFGTGD